MRAFFLFYGNNNDVPTLCFFSLYFRALHTSLACIQGLPFIITTNKSIALNINSMTENILCILKHLTKIRFFSFAIYLRNLSIKFIICHKSYPLPLSCLCLCAPHVSTWLLFSSDKDSWRMFHFVLIICT